MKRWVVIGLVVLCWSVAVAKVHVYRNIPYATAERFKESVINDEFDINGNYDERGCMCMQRIWQDTVWDMDNYDKVGSECLTLTVNSPYEWSKKDGGHELLPVMIHIHGGSYINGSGQAPTTDMDELAEKENMVTVSISYRLGVWGFLHQPDSGSCNLGLHDQMNALRWVKQHIVEFGGDTTRMTLTGQSAGAQSVVYLIAEMKDLPVQQAIVFSAPMGLTRSEGKARQYRREFVKILEKDAWGADDEELLKAQNTFRGRHRYVAMPFAPTGLKQMPKVLPSSRLKRVVVCAQKDDASVFTPKAFGKLVTAEVFVRPSKQYVKYLNRQGVEATYHEFTWEPTGSRFKATHCDELPLFLSHVDNWVGCAIVGRSSAEELVRLREEFMSRLARFVATGEWGS